MIILIDNYDSFTFNVYHYLSELGAKVKVYRNDEIKPERILGMNPKAIIISPGPKTPNQAGICLDLIKINKDIPVLGICLGHQSIGQAYGGIIIQAGGGIVYDSNPEKEYQETINKANALVAAAEDSYKYE